MECPSCGATVDRSDAFCSSCGTKLVPTCASCGAELRPSDRFCAKCGTQTSDGQREAEPATLGHEFSRLKEQLPQSLQSRLSVETNGETRLVTVLLADMSGSVERTHGLDPEDAANLVSSLLSTMIDVLSKYDCRIDNIVGDEVVAVFGAPTMHEDDPERAILAGLEIIENVRKLGLDASIGINTGEAYFGGLGSEEHTKTTVYGEVINLAARLQGAAEAGTIVVGEGTYRHARRAFDFEAMTLSVKGISEAVAAYRVVAKKPHMDKVRGIEGMRAELIGRSEELEKLAGAIDELVQGRGQVVTLIGEAGVGKSRLAAELRTYVENLDRPPAWLEGRCLEFGITANYWAFVDLLRIYFGFEMDDNEADRAARIEAKMDRLCTDAQLRKERTEEIGAFIGMLLSVRFDSEWDVIPEEFSTDQLANNIHYAVRDLLTAEASRQPLVLVFDDLHWADSDSLDLISLLMDTLSNSPMLLLCVYRPVEDHKCWHLGQLALRKCSDRHTNIRLNELTENQSRRLVNSLLSIDNLPETVREMIVAKAEGNPFFVEEVVRSLIDSGLVFREEDSWSAKSEVVDVEIPNSVQSVILSRVDRLENDLRHLLQSASVIGRIFRRRVLEEIRGKEDELESKLHSLEDSSLIYQERAIPELEFSFTHALTQEAVYSTILKSHRSKFHALVASALEALYENDLDDYYEEIAYHYSKSENTFKAIEYRILAAEKARYICSNVAAVEHCRAGLALSEQLPEGIERDELQIRLYLALAGPVGLVYGHFAPEAEEAWGRVVELSGSKAASHELLEGLHGVISAKLITGASVDELKRLSEAHGNVAQRLADRSSLMDHHLIAGITAWYRGNHHVACDLTEKVPNEFILSEDRGLAKIRGHCPRTTSQSYLCTIYWLLGYYEEAMATIERGEVWVDEVDHPVSRCHIYLMFGATIALVGDMAQAVEMTDMAMKLADELDLPLFTLYHKTTYHYARYFESKGPADLALLSVQIGKAESANAMFMLPTFKFMFARAQLTADRAKEALMTINEGISLIDAGAERWHWADLLRLRGDIKHALAAPEAEILAEYDRAMEIACGQDAKILELRTAISRYEYLSINGARDKIITSEARRELEEIYSWFTSGFDTPDMVKAASLLVD